MKICYIAHPISGDVEGNLKNINGIVRDINMGTDDVAPFVPYYSDLMAMHDHIPYERERCFKNNMAYFEKGLIDELWVYGDKISEGVQYEIDLAKKYFIPIRYKNEELVSKG